MISSQHRVHLIPSQNDPLPLTTSFPNEANKGLHSTLPTWAGSEDISESDPRIVRPSDVHGVCLPQQGVRLEWHGGLPRIDIDIAIYSKGDRSAGGVHDYKISGTGVFTETSIINANLCWVRLGAVFGGIFDRLLSLFR